MAILTIHRHQGQAECYTEDLGEGIGLEMVVIPAGTFRMGSPEDELERLDRESPQHEVNVPSFHIGRYPLTSSPL